MSYEMAGKGAKMNNIGVVVACVVLAAASFDMSGCAHLPTVSGGRGSPAAQEPLRGVSLDIPTTIPVQYVWQAMGVGLDGTIYIGGCVNPRSNASANLSALDPQTLRFRELAASMDRTLGLRTELPSFKIHTPFVTGPDGRIYGATHTELRKDAASGWTEYAGGHFFVYDPVRGTITDLGLGLANKGIVAMDIDFAAGKLYGLCYPGSVLVETDMMTGRSVQRGRMGTTNINRNLRILRNKIYTAEQSDGNLVEFDPATAAILSTPWFLPTSPEPAADATQRKGFWASVVEPSGESLVGVTTAGGRLFRFDPSRGITDYGPLVPGARIFCEAMAVSPDGKWLYCFHGPDTNGEARVEPGVARFSYPECRRAGWRAIRDAADPTRQVRDVTAGTCGRDGRLYLAVKYDQPREKAGRTEVLVLDPGDWKE